jgi:hypothetical protein
MNRLIAQYNRGQLTDHELIIRCLNTVDPTNPSSVLDLLPPNTIGYLIEFVNGFQEGKMLGNYESDPSLEQVRAAQRWLLLH